MQNEQTSQQTPKAILQRFFENNSAFTKEAGTLETLTDSCDVLNALSNNIFQLQILHDSDRGITSYVSNDMLIRDAREAKENKAQYGSSQIQALNILRGAYKVAETYKTTEIEASLSLDKLNDFNKFVKDQANNIINNKISPEALKPKNFNTMIVQKLADLGIKDPAKKLNIAKDFCNLLEDKHYDVCTITKIDANDSMVEYDKRALDNDIASKYKNLDEQEWFNTQDEFTKNLIRGNVDKIPGKVLPTQLRGQLVGIRKRLHKNNIHSLW
jgi:hypothetical protein